MVPENAPHPVRRVLLVGVALFLLFLLGLGGWVLTRRITPGPFVLRVVPSGAAPDGLSLSLLGPGGAKLAEWRFQGVPGPSVLADVDRKVPWTAVATNASQSRPCITFESAPFVPPAALAPVERLVLSRCCPGVTDAARCPIRRLTLGR
jgi:hypothetical protein